MTFLTILGVTEICSFRLVVEGKKGKEIPEPSRLEFLENFQQTVLLYQMQNITSGLLNRGGIADLPFVKNAISNSPKVTRAKFLKVMNSFVLLACVSLAASITLLQRLLACLNFTLESKNLSFRYTQKK